MAGVLLHRCGWLWVIWNEAGDEGLGFVGEGTGFLDFGLAGLGVDTFEGWLGVGVSVLWGWFGLGNRVHRLFLRVCGVVGVIGLSFLLYVLSGSCEFFLAHKFH